MDEIMERIQNLEVEINSNDLDLTIVRDQLNSLAAIVGDMAGFMRMANKPIQPTEDGG